MGTCYAKFATNVKDHKPSARSADGKGDVKAKGNSPSVEHAPGSFTVRPRKDSACVLYHKLSYAFLEILGLVRRCCFETAV